MRRQRHRFTNLIAGEYGYPTIVEIENLSRLRLCAGFGVATCQMPHGHAQSTGYRFDCDGKIISYATDFSEITANMVTLFDRSDILVIDCLRREPHPTHAHLAMALELAEAARVRRAVLTHMDKSMDYAMLTRELPAHVEVGYDGLELTA
jgi:phosphoribosyl 1,2-cyclic phosphate phosphodiesterase